MDGFDEMSPQLAELLHDLRVASSGFAVLATRASAEGWRRRPAEGSWSAAECLTHLSLTSEAYLPLLRHGVEEARSLDASAPRRYRRDPTGWLLWRMMGPPVRIRTATSPSFLPVDDASTNEMLNRFEALQSEAASLIRDASGLPLHRVRVQSPFDQRVWYNLFAALSILPRHQLRHLWQAERAVAAARPHV